MPTAVRSLLAAVVATAAVVGAGVALSAPEDDEPVAEVVPTTTTIADLDTSTAAGRRTGFCDRVAPEDVAEALGSAPTADSSYENGEPMPLAAGGDDVAHEFSCTWTGADGTVARGWVFAPPVTPERARDLRRLAVRTPECRRLPDAPAFGASSAALRCSVDGAREVSFRGLLGDAWLTCALRGPETDDLEDRADRWCASVLLAATAEL